MKEKLLFSSGLRRIEDDCSDDYRDARETLWLVEDYVISCYNHPARGDNSTEALNFKMAAARFLDVSEEETTKLIQKENAVALIITWVIILK